MKLRFGQSQASLHACDVMMRDMKDSERIRTAINKTLKPVALNGLVQVPLQNLNTCIVSKGYWDSMQNEEAGTGANSSMGMPFMPPPFLKKTFDDFAAKYQQFKRMRTVVFKPNLGSV
jgi:hypothetical protein